MTFPTFRRLVAGGPALALVVLSACATPGAPAANTELERLSADCEARGGILVPSNRQTGREAVDNYCRISGGPSDRLRPRD